MNGLPGIRRIAAHGFTGYAIDTSGGLRARGSGSALDVSGHHAIVGTG